ncbi:ORF1 [Wisteria badnavirus 1]|uniref:ORF1 n=1 Tax=Wisteria badnavirus 1 TaxID=1973265 RepID=A0A1U9IRQ9_9VIRU|nr:ORF1 [Wisteria badnavirus 1]AQM50985.1 ORF1 [Wisteria badnavirus 1]
MSREEDYKAFLEEWNPDPKDKEANFLDSILPEPHHLNRHYYNLPCFHLESTAHNHSLGKKSSEPTTSSQLDLLLTLVHNQSIHYDRTIRFHQAIFSQLERIETRLTTLEARQPPTSNTNQTQTPKPPRKEYLDLFQRLEDRLKAIEDNIPS